jgi:hypothetical protein
LAGDAPKPAAAFQPRDRRFTADSDTIMEAVVKVCVGCFVWAVAAEVMSG